MGSGPGRGDRKSAAGQPVVIGIRRTAGRSSGHIALFHMDVAHRLPFDSYVGFMAFRNGVPLAVSTPVTTLWMNPRQAIAAGADIGKLAKALGQSPRDLSARVQRNRSKGFIYLKRHLSPTDAEGVLALDIPGVFGMTEYRRFYPEGEATAHLLGFTDLDDHGKEGLELAFDEELVGRAGSKRVVKDLKGHRVQDVSLIKAAHPGLPVFPSGDAATRKVSAAWLIETCGWKGFREGDAGVAAQHALVLVNHGNATGAQILDLARRIAGSVRERFGIALEPEPRIIGARFAP